MHNSMSKTRKNACTAAPRSDDVESRGEINLIWIVHIQNEKNAVEEKWRNIMHV